MFRVSDFNYVAGKIVLNHHRQQCHHENDLHHEHHHHHRHENVPCLLRRRHEPNHRYTRPQIEAPALCPEPEWDPSHSASPTVSMHEGKGLRFIYHMGVSENRGPLYIYIYICI